MLSFQDHLRALMAGVPMPTISGSVRCRHPISGTTYIAGLQARGKRERHYATKTTDSPQASWFNGRILNTGVAGSEIELPAAYAVPLRAAWLTGISGTSLNQTAATLTQMTFFGMLSNASFVSAGGLVSGDGLQVTMPANWLGLVSSDPAIGLTLSGEYFLQSEYFIDSNVVGQVFTSASVLDGTFGDAKAEGTTSGQYVYSKNWTTGGQLMATPGTVSGNGPIYISGIGPAGTKVVAVDGDSIIADVASGTGASAANVDLGYETYGAKNFAKRALTAAGYSFFDSSVSGTRVEDLMTGVQAFTIRGWPMQFCDAVITDMLHNDRRSGRAFGDAFGLGTLMTWHNTFLRSKLKVGARVVRATMAPGTTSTDLWVTTANQTFKNDDCTYPGGDQWTARDRILRQGAYAALGYGIPGECDGAFDLASYFTDAPTGNWAVNGTANYATIDGTHGTLVLQKAAAAALQPQLPTLLGF